MTKKKVIFISPPSYGHIIKTILIAKYYLSKGCDVHYFVNGENNHFFSLHKFEYTVLKTKPFAFGKETKGKQNFVENCKEWCKFMYAQLIRKGYYARKKEIEEIITKHKPDLVFLDEFSVTDFLFIQPFMQHFKLIVLTPFLPSKENTGVPPLDVLSTKADNLDFLWKKHNDTFLAIEKKKRRTYLLLDYVSQIKRAMKRQKFPSHLQADFSWERIPEFLGIEKWYLQPYEIDFVKQELPSYQRYMGPMIDLQRNEYSNERYALFLKHSRMPSYTKVVFCSLGSVITGLISNENKLINFYNNMAEVAAQNMHCLFAVKIPATLMNKVKPKSVNFFVFVDIPYFAILKLADVFITHCGGNSYLESIYMETPMLAIPPLNKWDYNGNASRVLYHEIGVNAQLNSSPDEISKKLNELLNDAAYLQNVKKISALLNQKYHVNYLHDEVMP